MNRQLFLDPNKKTNVFLFINNCLKANYDSRLIIISVKGLFKNF